MRASRLHSLSALLLAGVALIASPAVAKTPAKAGTSADQRAAALVARMTEDEKLQLVRTWFPPKTMGQPGAPTDMVPSAGEMIAIPRLGIPSLRESDASLGVANQVEQRKGDTATALPASLATAASFDPDVAYAGGAMIGAEARAKRFNVLLAGGVNLTRDPWGGRNFEYMGEDPLLSGVMAGAHIRGVQSNHIVSTVKHYVLNPQETGRMVIDGRIAEPALRESDLLAFQIAIEQGKPGSVMCAYVLVNGDYACESHRTLTDILRKDWGYSGFVMSDWGAVHSTVKAALAGLDQESGAELDKAIYFGAPLKAALADGSVPRARLDEMAKNVLIGMIETGLFDTPLPATLQPIDTDAHADVAQHAAEEGIVLLRNEGRLLPLAKTAKHIVLIAGHADVGVLSGGGSSQVRSTGGVPIEVPLTSGPAASFARLTYHSSSPLRAIRAAFPGADVTYVDGSDPQVAAAAAKTADMAILFATQWRTEAEDVTTLALPGGQDALIDAVAAANPRTAVVLETGGPVLMPWLDKVGAVLAAWYPGQRGGEAIARILSGAVNPSGHLPITFPKAASQAPRPEPVNLAAFQSEEMNAASNAGDTGKEVPPFSADYKEGADVGYRWYEATRQTPLFPFGFGLSYTHFAYANLKVGGGRTITVSFDVTNKGDRAGADVPQFYVAPETGGWPTRLAGFQRVSLKPGETRHVTLVADRRLLARWDEAAHGWHVSAGRYKAVIGAHAGDAALSADTMLANQNFRP